MLIIIDPGHGGQDPGAVNNNYQEKNINLEVSKIVKYKLQQLGLSCYLTREDDITLSLQKRVDISRIKQADIFISIHCNSSVKQTAAGIETFAYTTDRPGPGYQLASDIQDRLIQTQRVIDRGVKTAELYVLKNQSSDLPSCLIELGFISNPTDCQRLVSIPGQLVSAQAIVEGIIRYINRKSGLNFYDVIPGAWSYEYIRKVCQAGVMNGYTDGTFKPEQPVTRQELAVCLAKILQL